MKRTGVFSAACRGERTERTPVWLMRQAGRYLPAYRRLRSRTGFLRLCLSPALAARATVEAAEILGVDAAILFSDLLLPLRPLGFRVDYDGRGGPRVGPPLRAPRDLSRLREVDCRSALAPVYEAAARARERLDPRVPLIGFAGAPFTLGAYLIEGGASRDWTETRRFMLRHPAAWRRLMEALSRLSAEHLREQVRAGAGAVQLFDSWVGCLSPADYRASVLPHTRAVFASLPRGVPAIHFGTHTAGLLEAMGEAGGTVMGLDHRVGIRPARRRLGSLPIMGNLDPAALLADRRTIERKAREILDAAGGRGHIFNLGHGVLPQTPVEHVKTLVGFVHRYRRGDE